tara:strand:- start:2326 stop:3156 length:831 start_codon:yes stop_codon:yes gene_type:complete
MSYDVSIVIPGFRTPNWINVYNSAAKACKRYNWEIVFIAPFDLPEELKDKGNVTLVKSLGNVPRCVQIGIPKTNSELFFLTVDDCEFAEDSLDLSLDEFMRTCSEEDAMAMIYGEGGNLMETKYWEVKTHGDFRLPGINQSWKIANQCIMHKKRFIELGGLDCENFEYLDKPIHDFMFRLQKAGGNIVFSPVHCCIATWFPGESGDHAPIHHAQISHDTPIFNTMYSMPTYYNDRVKLNYNNYLNGDKIWKRRFSKGIPRSYKELCEQEGYTPHYD